MSSIELSISGDYIFIAPNTVTQGSSTVNSDEKIWILETKLSPDLQYKFEVPIVKKFWISNLKPRTLSSRQYKILRRGNLIDCGLEVIFCLLF